MPIHNQGIYLVDVREIDEYESGHVKGAINIPLSEFSKIRLTEYLSHP
ncbi:MAG: rhodanese-like domain-containing protein [Acidimicrobiaceae bacterium]